MSDRPNTYALLVGINEYPEPIPRLKGCIRDVHRVQEYLQNHVGSIASDAVKVRHTPSRLSVLEQDTLRLCVLEDEEATYPNIIAGFREHLAEAKADDVIWFHFSGHGTETYTAKEFRESLEPNGKDQNLVCYTRQPATEPFLLADKELAILLHELANDPAKERPPHIIVSLDCCHSGSGTRSHEWGDTEIVPRMTQLGMADSWEEAVTAGQVRSLTSYLDGYFVENKLDLPLSEHILFSACTSIQTAGDTLRGGIFTNSLIDTLATAEGPLNYADLFLRTRALVRKARKEQLPQFETIGGFNPYRQFLDGRPQGDPDRYELVWERKQWLIKCGAIHGIPVRPESPIKVEIIAEDAVVGTGLLTAVGAQKSKVEIADAVELNADGFYQARITYLPLPPVQVALTGEESAIAAIIAEWRPELGIQWVRGAAAESAELLVELDADAHKIIDQEIGREVLAVSPHDSSAGLIVSSLGKIVRWERIRALHNRRSRIRSRVKLELELLLNGNQREHHTAAEVELEAATTNFFDRQGTLGVGLQPKIRITDRAQALYCYLYHLRSDYSIDAYEGEVVFRPEEHPGTGDLVLPLLKTHKGWGLGPEDRSAFSYFKLFVTTEPLDYQQLLQSGLSGDRAANWNWNPVAVSNDWCTLDMKITMKR